MPELKQQRRYLAAALLAWLACAGSSHAQEIRISDDVPFPLSDVATEVGEVDETLRAGKWKAGLRRANKLTEIVLGRAWHGRELRRILADLALYQAIAEANLGRRDDAIWHWHIAHNLDSATRRHDLAPYGDAGKLLYEFPLRAEGKIPVGFEVPRRLPSDPPIYGPKKPPMTSRPTVLNNTGAALEGTGNFHVEVIIDEKGRLHQPVVTSTHLHPIVIYASLEWLRKLPRFEPARFNGETVDALERVTVQFIVNRW